MIDEQSIVASQDPLRADLDDAWSRLSEEDRRKLIDSARQLIDGRVEREFPCEVKLAHPIAFGKITIQSLVFRRGRAGDLEGVPLDGVPAMDKILMIASRMANTPVAALKMLDGDDTSEVVAIALGFFGRCLAGGATRSR